MAGEFGEIKMQVERFRIVVDAVEDDRDERESLPGLVAILQSLSKKSLPKTGSVAVGRNPEPRHYCRGKQPPREFFRQL